MKFTPLRIALIFLAFALIWVFTTDSLLLSFIQDPDLLTRLQVAKGFIFVTGTAIGLYLMMKSYEKFIRKEEVKLKEIEQSLNLALNSAQMATWQYFPDGDHYITSPNHNRLFGLSENLKLKLEHVINRLDKDFEREFHLKAERTLRAGDDFNIEYKILTPEGDERWLWSKGSASIKNGKVESVSGVTVNISEKKKLENKLKVEQEKFEKLFHKIPVLITMFDPSLNVSVVNSEFEKTLGWDDVDAKSVDLMEVCFPDPGQREDAAEFMRKPNTGWKEMKLTAKNGRVRDQVWTNITLSDDTIVGIGHDITKRKEHERLLKKSQNQLLKAQQIARLGYWELSLKDFSFEWSDMTYRILGRDKENKVPDYKTFLREIVHPDDKTMIEKSFRRCITAGSEEIIYRIMKPGEETAFIQGNAELIYDENGEKKALAGTVLDITNLKKTEQELLEKDRLIEKIQQVAKLGTYVLNTKTKEVRNSKVMDDIYGQQEGETMTYEKWARMIHPDDRHVIDEFEQAQNSNKPFTREYRIYRESDNELRWIYEKGGHVLDENGNSAAMVGTMQDITRLKEIQQKLEFEQKRFEYAAMVVSDAIWDAVPNQKNVWWSEGFKNNFGYDIPEYDLGYDTWKENVHPDDREWVINSLIEVENTEDNYWEGEYRFRRADGSYAVVFDQAYVLRDDYGNVIRIIGAMNDITREKMEEESLKRSEEHYRLLFEQSPIPMWIYDPETLKFESANKAAREKYGYSEKEFKNMLVTDIHSERDREEVLDMIKENLKHDRSGFNVWTNVVKSGDEILTEMSGSYIYSGDKRKRLLIANDITAQRKSEEKAFRAMVEGEERERQRIANELHDGLGQYLSAANMNLTSVYDDLPGLDKNLKKPFENGLQMLEYAISETRLISQNLLPKSIQDYGLKLAVKALINDFKAVHEVDFHLYQNYPDDKLPQNIQINIYRIIQESLNNVLRHANASEVNVQINLSNDELICTIEDNGKGFIPKDIDASGLGIQSMKTRVAAMAGNFDIDSKEGSGTLITVIIPLGG